LEYFNIGFNIGGIVPHMVEYFLPITPFFNVGGIVPHMVPHMVGIFQHRFQHRRYGAA
jgi:hypothetical protein